MRNKRREIEGVSLSFLDVISCGFAALILLLVLTKVFEPIILEDTIENLQGYLASLQEDLFNIRGDTRDINRKMVRKEDLHKEKLERLTRLQANLSTLETELDKTLSKSRLNNTIEGRLAKARQELTEEMKRLLADYQKAQDDTTIGGIPVDSEYVIFIIDTSGSMHSYAWPLVLQKVTETLDVYPRLKGIQVMNDMGNYMFSQYANEWIPDTGVRRQAIIDRLQTWSPFSNSSPVEGITKAIATFYRPDRKISLYVFGDEFTGRSIQQVINVVDKINREDADGNRLVRIHAVGFPVMFAQPPRFQETGIKFAILMRELCKRNGGTFVALNDFRTI
ncbi:MAG: VWA domain-containing protein [Gammaproteobacteria bacterium]|nr:VWA domain-containing protein [Gammaproteobacteria bacterium]